MEILALDRLFAIFFLIVLVTFVKVGHLLEREDRSGYRQIILGVTLLALAAVSNSLANSAFLAGIPILSDPGFVDLLAWIASISGLVLIVAGVSVWLPLSRYYRKYNRERINMLESITQVAQLIRIETRFTELMGNSTRYLFEGCRLNGAALYIMSPRRRRAFFLKSYFRSGEREIQAGAVRFGDKIWQRRVSPNSFRNIELIQFLPPTLNTPTIVEPVFASGRIVAVMLMWSDQPESTIDDIRQVTTTVAKMLGRRARSMLLEEQLEYFASERSLVESLLSQEVSDADNKSILLGLASRLKKEIPFRTISMSHISSGETGSRFTLGSNGALLEEVGLDNSKAISSIQRIANGRRSVIVDHLGKENISDAAIEMLHNGGLQSDAVLVMVKDQDRYVQLSLTFDDPSKYRARHRFLLDAAAGVVIDKLAQVDSTALRMRAEKSLTAIDELSRFAVEEGFQSAARQAAQLLVENSSADFVRISIADERNVFMSSIALNMSQRFKPKIPEDGHMVLAIMPAHRRAAETGEEIVWINDDTGDLEQTEPGQAFASGFSQMQIIPVPVHNKTLMISLGKMTGSGAAETIPPIAHLVAGVLASALEASLSTTAVGAEEDFVAHHTGQSRAQLRSALAALSGAADLIEGSPTNPRNLRNYVTIMRKSIDKISELARNRDNIRNPETDRREKSATVDLI